MRSGTRFPRTSQVRNKTAYSDKDQNQPLTSGSRTWKAAGRTTFPLAPSDRSYRSRCQQPPICLLEQWSRFCGFNVQAISGAAFRRYYVQVRTILGGQKVPALHTEIQHDFIALVHATKLNKDGVFV